MMLRMEAPPTLKGLFLAAVDYKIAFGAHPPDHAICHALTDLVTP